MNDTRNVAGKNKNGNEPGRNASANKLTSDEVNQRMKKDPTKERKGRMKR